MTCIIHIQPMKKFQHLRQHAGSSGTTQVGSLHTAAPPAKTAGLPTHLVIAYMIILGWKLPTCMRLLSQSREELKFISEARLDRTEECCPGSHWSMCAMTPLQGTYSGCGDSDTIL